MSGGGDHFSSGVWSRQCESSSDPQCAAIELAITLTRRTALFFVATYHAIMATALQKDVQALFTALHEEVRQNNIGNVVSALETLTVRTSG